MQQSSTPNSTSPFTKMNGKQASKASVARWWRQAAYIPIWQSRWLTREVMQRLTAGVAKAEVGHRGEVFLIIENHIPLNIAYRKDVYERAIDLFGHYRVWDTEENTGVLIYVNLCERALEIIADRGINSHVNYTVWRAMCDKAIAGMAKGNIEDSLLDLIDEVGQLLKHHYYLENDPRGNELADTMVYLK